MFVKHTDDVIIIRSSKYYIAIHTTQGSRLGIEYGEEYRFLLFLFSFNILGICVVMWMHIPYCYSSNDCLNAYDHHMKYIIIYRDRHPSIVCLCRVHEWKCRHKDTPSYCFILFYYYFVIVTHHTHTHVRVFFVGYLYGKNTQVKTY